LALEDKVNVTVATTPLPIVLALTPVNTQVKAPLTPPHNRDFEALVAAGPAVTLRALKSVVEKTKVH
jgi:hypothetical protein